RSRRAPARALRRRQRRGDDARRAAAAPPRRDRRPPRRGLRARRRRGDRRNRVRAGSRVVRNLPEPMRRVVLKLGSTIVADDRGALRRDVLARISGVAADLHDAGDEVVVVTSGAIARGIEVLDIPVRPTAIDELQAASAVGQGKLYRVYDELLRTRGV